MFELIIAILILYVGIRCTRAGVNGVVNGLSAIAESVRDMFKK